MATKILVGLVVALFGTGLGVYVAFNGSSLTGAARAGGAAAVSEGGCCSHAESCCEAEPRTACCEEGSACGTSDAVAACTGGTALGQSAPAPAVKSRVRTGHTTAD